MMDHPDDATLFADIIKNLPIPTGPQRPVRCAYNNTTGRPCKLPPATRLGPSGLVTFDGCAWHSKSEIEALEEANREHERQRTPACWTWTVPDDLLHRGRAINELPEGDLPARSSAAQALLREWQQQTGEWLHCAICGRQMASRDKVLDHDHVTGLIRGFLCRPCNTTEGLASRGEFKRYREKHPAAILGNFRAFYHDPFTGWAEPQPAPNLDEWRRQEATDRLTLPQGAAPPERALLSGRRPLP